MPASSRPDDALAALAGPVGSKATWRRAALAAAAALALLAGVPGSQAPPTPDRPLAPVAGGWTDEPSAASLAATATGSTESGAEGGQAELFYFVLPDRFANADPGNDTGGYPGDRLQTGLDPTDKGFYHGGDLKGVLDRLDYIEGLGTTAIWLAPVFKNNPVQGSGADVSAGYHGYWITHFTGGASRSSSTSSPTTPPTSSATPRTSTRTGPRPTRRTRTRTAARSTTAPTPRETAASRP